MRRPSQTKAQRTFNRSQRALLRLRKASAAYTFAMDAEEHDDGDASLIERLTDLQAAANAYYNNLSPREKRKLLR